MLTILHDPAGITGRQQHAWDFSRTMQENIAQHLTSGGDCELLINGIKVDPLTDRRLDMPPSLLDLVTVVRRPEGIETWLLVISLTLSVAAYAMMPSIPGTTTAKESPNNSLTGQTNIARAYQAIPDVYGYRRVWPDLIQASVVEYINHIKYVTEWLCVSRGKGTISDVQYAETPIASIDGASFEVFEPAASPSAYPELNDTTLTNVIEVFESSEVNGQELPYAVGSSTLLITRNALMTTVIATGNFSLTMTDGSDLDPLKAAVGASVNVAEGVFELNDACTVVNYSTSGFDVTFNFAAATHVFAVSQTDYAVNVAIEISGFTPSTTTVGPFTLPVDSEGIRYNIVFLRGLKGAVTVDVEFWQIDGGGTEIGGTRQTVNETYTADTFDQRYYTSTVFPTAGAGRYVVEFTRTNVATTDGSDVAKLEEVYAVRRYATKVLPGVTVIRVTTKATSQATGFSDRKFNLRWARHVRMLTADTLGASRNFARTMAHIWTLAGQDIDDLDTTALGAISAEFGETHDLLRFDGSFDDADMSLGERMQRVANNARCVLWRDGTKWTVTRDQARTAPELQLDYRNLAANGDSAISYAAHLPASFDGIELEYVDETTQAKKAYVRLNVSSGSVVSGLSANPKKIKMPSCTTWTQADNRAQVEARRLLYQRTSVSDTALADGLQLGPGSLVRWIDPGDFAGDDGLQAGEVMAIDVPGLEITTSEVLDWKGEASGRILFTGVDGQHLGAPIVCTPGADAYSVLQASVPAGLYVAGIDRQLGSRYAFAVGLTEAEIEASGLYTVTEVAPTADRTVSLAMVNYDARIYELDPVIDGTPSTLIVEQSTDNVATEGGDQIEL